MRSKLLAIYLVVGSFLIGFCSIAHAQGTPDPIAIATGATDNGLAILTQYGWLWGSMLLVYGIASALLAAHKSDAWLAQGRRLAIAIAALGIFASVLQTHFQGGQWSGVTITAVLAIFKVLNPVVTPPTTPTKMQGGFAGLRVMIALAALGSATLTASSCSWFRGSVEPDIGKVIDCAKTEATAANIFDIIATFAAAVAKGDTGSAVDALVTKYGAQIVACSLRAIEQQPTLGAGSGSAVGAELTDPWARAADDQIKRHGWTFK